VVLKTSAARGIRGHKQSAVSGINSNQVDHQQLTAQQSNSLYVAIPQTPPCLCWTAIDTRFLRETPADPYHQQSAVASNGDRFFPMCIFLTGFFSMQWCSFLLRPAQRRGAQKTKQLADGSTTGTRMVNNITEKMAHSQPLVGPSVECSCYIGGFLSPW
jgi:hypothetical protein